MPSWSNNLWQGWSCRLVHCPCGNATDPIWRVLATSDGISSWTPVKCQHSNPNPKLLANQLWSIDLVHCPYGNATDPIWRVLASSDGISSWTPLKPQHSNPKPFANQLWCIDFLTPPTPLIIPHRLPAFLESLIPLRNSRSIHARWLKSSLKYSIRFCGIFSKFKTEFYYISFF